MSTIINGTTDAITFPDATIQNTSAVVSGKVPYSVLPAGSVLQVVNATYSTATSNSVNSMAASGLTASITPKFSTSKILVMTNMTAGQSNNSGNGINLTIYRNGSFLIAAGTLTAYNNAATITIGSNSATYLDSPATTSSTTYSLWFAPNTNGQNVTVQANNSPSYITLMEIAG